MINLLAANTANTHLNVPFLYRHVGLLHQTKQELQLAQRHTPVN